jgi:hypothetical protein
VHLTGLQRVGHRRRPVQHDVRGQSHQCSVLAARGLALGGIDHHCLATVGRGHLDGSRESCASAATQVHGLAHLDQLLGARPGRLPDPPAMSLKARSVADPGEQRRTRGNHGVQSHLVADDGMRRDGNG